MAYTTPRTWVAGDVLTAAQLNTDVRDNVSFLANPPACRVSGAQQAIAHTTQVLVAFNSEVFDTAALHDTATNNSRITMPVAGIYLVDFTGKLDAAADYTATYAALRLNGATVIDEHFDGAVTTTDSAPRFKLHATYKFAATDYVEVLVYQRNGASASRNLVSVASSSPVFSAVWAGLG